MLYEHCTVFLFSLAGNFYLMLYAHEKAVPGASNHAGLDGRWGCCSSSPTWLVMPIALHRTGCCVLPIGCSSSNAQLLLTAQPAIWGQLAAVALVNSPLYMIWQLISAYYYFKWYSAELCRRINWNFPRQSLEANTISDWRWCQIHACVFALATGNTE